MRVLFAENAEEGLVKGIRLLEQIGVRRDSRYGEVLYGGTVATVYANPWQRVVMWPSRDANPFFHLYESLWMLRGRNDVPSVARYAKRMETFSDDGLTFHGAYGHRWRKHFNFDQLSQIASILRTNPLDRRCILQMWDAKVDLGKQGKDVPCNVSALFERGVDGALNLIVFNRSNDIIWGAYGANVVHFSMLLEYMALKIGCEMGTYTQISSNWHAYTEVFDKLRSRPFPQYPPYEGVSTNLMSSEEDIDLSITRIVGMTDLNELSTTDPKDLDIRLGSWGHMVYRVLRAHEIYRFSGAEHALVSLEGLGEIDWVVAARQWLSRRVK